MTDRLGLAGCFAGLSSGEAARRDMATGEIRIPLTVYAIEGRMGSVDLVLSAAEAEPLHAWLSRAISPGRLPGQARLAEQARFGAPR